MNTISQDPKKAFPQISFHTFNPFFAFQVNYSFYIHSPCSLYILKIATSPILKHRHAAK